MQPGYRASVWAVVLVMWPLAVAAQPPAETKADLARWDVTFLAASLSGHDKAGDVDRFGDDWFTTGQAGVVIGRQWNTHVRTEIGVSGSGEGRQYVQYVVTVPGFPQPVFYSGERFTSLREVSATAMWQFFENQWVHPFVEAGVAIDTERTRVSVPPFQYYSGDPRLPDTLDASFPERREGPTTTTTARALLGGGVKLYITPRLFARTDARMAIRSRVEYIALRAGLGFEF